MNHYSIDHTIFEQIPNFKIGFVTYYNIVTSESPQMVKGRLQFFQEMLNIELDMKPLTQFEGILEWREAFKTMKMNPKRYPPSHEALYTRIKKGQTLPFVHSAVDLNTFFSLQYCIPFGIYDLSKLNGIVTLRLGNKSDHYEGLNGRINNMGGKLISSDDDGAFGSPIVDSIRTKVTTNTTSALHIIYLRPSMSLHEAEQLVHSVGKSFVQIHGGTFSSKIISNHV